MLMVSHVWVELGWGGERDTLDGSGWGMTKKAKEFGVWPRGSSEPAWMCRDHRRQRHRTAKCGRLGRSRVTRCKVKRTRLETRTC